MRTGVAIVALVAAGFGSAATAQTELSLWYHGAGSANAEEATMLRVRHASVSMLSYPTP